MRKIHHPLPPRCAAEHAAYAVVATLRGAGYAGYTVGGAVRDRLLERQPGDVDVATDATPDQVMALFPRTVAVGAAFGVVIVLQDDEQVEVATFRVDMDYEDGRRPTGVQYSSPPEDAERRDFTVNALFYDPVTEEIVDYVGGFEDLRHGVLRAIGEPARRFAEDYLRMLRAVRFTVQLDFALDPATAAAIRATAHKIDQISPERIYTELTKMLVGRRPHRAIALLDDCGLLAPILPEIVAMKGVEQPAEYHPEGDVWVHTLLLLEHMAHPDPILAWSVLLHDVGKPPTFEINKHGRESFPCHADVGAAMSREILRRLRCSNEVIDAVEACVDYHMVFGDVGRMRAATRRRLMGRANFYTELELHRIDCMACHCNLDNYTLLLDYIHELANTPAVPPPLLTGRDVMALGIKPGPRIGELLSTALDLQMEDELADRDAALAWLRDQVAADGADNG